MSGPLRLRIEPGDASETWKRSEGRIVAGKYPLIFYLAGYDDSAVFLTSIKTANDSKEAAIKLIYAGATDVEKQLKQWITARDLDHPNLIRIFEAGRCEIDGMQLLYVVQEYAEENLAQILPERALSPEETREMLPPVLGALQFLHEKGFRHGHIQPSNILASGDQVKLSSDSLIASDEKGRQATAGKIYDPPERESDVVSTASDIWQLGVTLSEVLTQQVPTWDRAGSRAPEVPRSMPEPFREITKQCLQVEPGKRWSIAQIRSALDGGGTKAGHSTPPTLALVQNAKPPAVKAQSIKASEPAELPTAPLDRQVPSAKWPYLLVLALAVGVALLLIFRPKPANRTFDQTSAKQSVGSTAEPPQRAPAVAQSVPNSSATNTGSGATDGTAAGSDGIVNRVIPEVSNAARRTIHGRILIRVKVKVDAAGDVTTATLQSSHASKYFSRISLDAARDWKFAAEQSGEQSRERVWNLQFAFTRAKTEASAAPANR